MNKEQSITLNGLTSKHMLHILNSVGMIAVSIYLTSHYYSAHFPTNLGGSNSLCDFSSFFNCDTATFSALSNLAGIPISFFGILIGVVLLFSSFMPSEDQEKTCSAITKFNFIGCILLFLYSLIVLHALCPFCTLYYVLSGVAAVLFWKSSYNTWIPAVKASAFWGVILVGGSIFLYQYAIEKAGAQEKLNAQVVQQFHALADLGDPDTESPYRIHTATTKFADAPLRISVFSDFQCPFCKVVSEQMPGLARRYKDKLNIQYMFFPLDNACNTNVKGSFHQYACKAAILAACDEKKFAEVHDEIFSAQEKLSDDTLMDIAKKHGMEKCLTDEAIKNKVIAIINQAAKYNIRSTPTMIVNGKKIEGTVSDVQFFAIFESILKK